MRRIYPESFGFGFIARNGARCFQNPRSALFFPETKLLFSDGTKPIFLLLLTWCELRVQVVLQDQLRPEPEYIGSWHIFLPSEVNLRCVKLELFSWLWSCLCPMCCQCASQLEPSRIQVATIRMHSLYHYDVDLFKRKFIGPPGVTWPESLLLMYVCFVFSFMICLQALQMFWDAQRDSDWFQNHPILSAKELLATSICFNQTQLFIFYMFRLC